MDLVMTLVIGGIVGWLASVLMRSDGQVGILASVVLGVAGSFLGNAIARGLGVAPQGVLAGWIVAILGAALLIALLRALGVFSKVAATR
jgi:uncharacterized membrane protein YeaQ/YmgE (transglycosylase-associated protein family)